MSTLLTRRAALTGAFASSAAVAVPSLAASRAEMPAGHALLNISGSVVEIDTSSLPLKQWVTYEDGEPSDDWWLMLVPEQGAEYAYFSPVDSDLKIGSLVAGHLDEREITSRGGYVDIPNHRYRMRQRVTVLGKVIV